MQKRLWGALALALVACGDSLLGDPSPEADGGAQGGETVDPTDGQASANGDDSRGSPLGTASLNDAQIAGTLVALHKAVITESQSVPMRAQSLAVRALADRLLSDHAVSTD